MRRPATTPLATLLAVLSACGAEPPPPDAAIDAGLAPLVRPDRPHVLLVTIDALRADHLGLYGYERGLSPELDALAESSLVFERAYTAAPNSSYSMCSLHLSEPVLERVQLGRELSAPTLADAMEGAGFRSAGFFLEGLFHTDGARLRELSSRSLGFDHHDPRVRGAEADTDRVLEHLDALVAEGEPASLIWLHYFDVHEPYRDTSLGTSNVDRYDGEIRNVDRALGRLLRTARARLRRPLVVAVTADHGEEHRDHGGLYHGTTCYDEQLRVPLLLHAPGLSPGRVRAPVSLVDLAPTLLATVGVEPPPSMRGRDVRGLRDVEPSLAPAVFAGVNHTRAMIAWPFKLIADLRTGDVELYDLARDPRERRDVADAEPERVARMLAGIRGWLTALRAPPGEAPDPSAAAAAIDAGRLRDGAAAGPLATLLADAAAPTGARAEAAALLGQLGGSRAPRELTRALDSTPPEVASAAAIALGRLGGAAARAPLRALISSDDAAIRADAALSLARLGDTAATPALVEALAGAPDPVVDDAVHWLGRLGDPRAVDALVDLARREGRFRYRAVTALGRIGDARALPLVVEQLEQPNRTTIRDACVRALGRLGAAAEVPRLVELGRQDPDLAYVGESLVRLGAVGERVGGVDAAPGVRGARGLSRCRRLQRPPWEEYRDATTCRSRGAVELSLPIPAGVAARPAPLLLLRARRLAPGSGRIGLWIGEHALPPLEVTDRYVEHRIVLPALEAGVARLRLEGDALELDHALVL